jgi:hypothetical protein
VAFEQVTARPAAVYFHLADRGQDLGWYARSVRILPRTSLGRRTS